MNNPTESTNDYLEFLAGRRPEPPIMPEGEEDILKAANLLRSLRSASPSPEFAQSLKRQVAPGAIQPKRKHQAALPPGQQPKHPKPTSGLWLRLTVPALALAAVIAVVVVPKSFWTGVFRGDGFKKYVVSEASAASITFDPTSKDNLGVDAGTHFILRAKEGTLTLPEIKSKLTFSPKLDVRVTEKGKNEFEVVPAGPLEPGTVYAASFEASDRTYSWAYQVRRTFQVIGTFPRDRAVSVPTTTGIEITFSDAGVSAKDFQDHLVVEPKTDGRVEVHNRTYVFVPKSKLKEKTLYAVTLKQGLKPVGAEEGLPDDLTFRFEAAVEGDSGPTVNPIIPSNVLESVRPGDPLVFAESSFPRIQSGAKQGQPAEYEFTVYQYRRMEDLAAAIEERQSKTFSWAYYANQSVSYPTDGLTKVGTFSTKSQAGIVTLGTGFDDGAYLADSTSNGVHSQIPFIASPIGAYVLTSRTDTLVWLNDMQSGQPISKASIAIRGTDRSASTGDDGTATLSTPAGVLAGTSTAVGTVEAGEKETLIILNGAPYYNYYYSGYDLRYPDGTMLAPPSDAYWNYVYTDRDMYQPNDRVNFWGLIKRRDNKQAPAKIHVDVVQRSYEGRYSVEILKSFDLSANSTGTFQGWIDLKEVSTAVYPEIVFSVDGQYVSSQSISVETYRKPAFKITVTPDRYAVINGDTITYDIATTFFDGTPVPNVGLKLEMNPEAATPVVTTDAQGRAVYKERAVTDRYQTSKFIGLIPFEQSDGTIEGSASVTVYPSHIQIDASGSISGTTGSLTGTVRNLHPERANPEASDPLAGVVGEPRPNQIVNGKVIAVVTEKISDGTHYDFLLKQTVESFHYTTVDQEREAFTVTTDANGKFTKTFTIDPKNFYRVELSAVDTKGFTASTSVYLWSSSAYGGTGQADLSLIDTSAGPNQPQPGYAVGDQVTLQVNQGSNPAPASLVKRTLFVTGQRGLRSRAVQASPTYTFTFGEDDVPSLGTRAVVFTGGSFKELFGPTVDFKESTRGLTIAVTPDRENYQPKETVKLNVRVTDTGGRGRQARVNLSAVDEAVVSLQGPRYLNPLGTVYAIVSDGFLGSYISHEAVDTFAGAERGGGGGDARVTFRDNALFTEIVTDANGNGSATMTLPDNLTSWRVTAHAVTDDLRVGFKERLVPVQKPVFALPSFSDHVLSQDTQTVSVRTYGSALTADDNANVSLSLPDDPEIDEMKKTGKAFSEVRFDLPKLEPGDHRLRVATESKGLKDTIIQTIHVAASNIQQRVVTTAYLERNQSPSLAPTGRTSLRIGDADRNLAYAGLWSLLGNPYSRLDDTIASRIAEDLLKTVFNEPIDINTGDPASFLTDKGIALYAIGSEDLEYGSLAAGDPGLVPYQGKLARWFRATVDDPKANTEQVAYALYGLAHMGEPVLSEVEALLLAPDLPDRERLTLSLALVALGAKEEARPIAMDLLKRYAESQDPYIRLKLGATDDERIVATARFTILAASLQLSEQYGLLQYIDAYPPKDTTTHLEMALALRQLLDHASAGTLSVTYTLNGQSETKELQPKDAVMLTLDSEQAKTFAITGHRGNVSVVSTYASAFDPTTATVDNRLSVRRTYSVNGKETTTFNQGDLVKIDLSWSKKAGDLGRDFAVVDLLPSGLRPITNAWIYSNGDSRFSYPYAVDGNRIKFYAYRENFFYYARAVTSGSSVAEPPMIQAFDAPRNLNYGSAATVTVK